MNVSTARDLTMRFCCALDSRSAAADRTKSHISWQSAATFCDHNNIGNLYQNRPAVRRPTVLLPSRDIGWLGSRRRISTQLSNTPGGVAFEMNAAKTVAFTVDEGVLRKGRSNLGVSPKGGRNRFVRAD